MTIISEMAQDNDFLAALAGAGCVAAGTAFDREDIHGITEPPQPSIGDKTVRGRELVASARDVIVNSPADIQNTPPDISQATPCASDADPPATVHHHSRRQRNSSRRRQETTRHEGLEELPQPALESVENNPLWACADSELKREHGDFYRRVFRKIKSDQHDNQEPGTLPYDPVRRATFMGFKIISLSFLPLTTIEYRLIWSLFQLICAVGITISQWVFSDIYISHCNNVIFLSEERCSTCRGLKVFVSILGFVTLFLALADFAVCAIHVVSRYIQCRPLGERQPLLNDGHVQTNTKCNIIVNMWDRYSDFLRIVVFDALFYGIFSLDTVLLVSCSYLIPSFNYSILSFLSIIASGITNICCVIFVQFLIFLALLCRSTCHKPHQTTGSRTVGLLLAFILNFIVQRAFQGYIASLSFTTSNFNKIIENENGTEIVIGSPPNTLAVTLFGGYLVSILGILTFFVLAFGWVKTVFIKTFRDFLVSLYQHQQNGQCSREDWERIQYVLDGYEYDALNSSAELAKKETYFIAPIRNLLLGTLMVPFLAALGLLLFQICQGEISKHCYASLSLGLSFNILYVMVGTVWLFYAIIIILNRFVSYSIGDLSSSHDENIVLHR